MSKTSKGKKIAIGLVVGVLATTAIVCATVPQVRESIKDLISKIKGEQTPEEKEKQDKEKAQEKAHDDDHYQNLTDDEKKDFDKKLDELVDSDHYKGLDDKGKDELLDKFVESEKVQQEIKNDKPDKKPAEIQNKISEKQNELENVQKEIEDLKNSGASEEEIAKAEEKQQQVEEQIKSAEQEKAYWETVETVKESTTNNTVFSIENPGTTIRRINGIYSYEGNAYFNIDAVKEEIIDGKSYYSQSNQFCRISEIVNGDETYEEVLKLISECAGIWVERTCINKNSQEQLDKFNEIKNGISSLTSLEKLGYTLSVVESWETTDYSNPEYIVKAQSEDDERWYMVTYEPHLDIYRRQPIQKICPEFWAQLEIERSQTATTSAEAKAQAIIDSFSTFDENGDLETFDYPAYQEYKKQKEAEKEAKEPEQNMTQQTSVTYSEQELGF